MLFLILLMGVMIIAARFTFPRVFNTDVSYWRFPACVFANKIYNIMVSVDAEG